MRKIIFAVLLACVGCSDQNADLKPRGDKPHNILFPNHLAECTKFDSSNGVKGLLSTIYDKGLYLPRNIQLDFTELPEDIFKNPKSFFQFNLWKISNGEKVFRKMPTNALFINKTTGAPIYKAFVDRIWQNTFEIASALGKLDSNQYTYKNFMKEFSLMLVEVDEEWEGLTINFYAAEDDKTPLYQIETLVPPFVSSPTKYSKEASVELASLHPLKNIDDPKINDEVHERRAKAICDAFDNDVNVPRPTFKTHIETLRRFKSFLHNL